MYMLLATWPDSVILPPHCKQVFLEGVPGAYLELSEFLADTDFRAGAANMPAVDINSTPRTRVPGSSSSSSCKIIQQQVRTAAVSPRGAGESAGGAGATAATAAGGGAGVTAAGAGGRAGGTAAGAGRGAGDEAAGARGRAGETAAGAGGRRAAAAAVQGEEEIGVVVECSPSSNDGSTCGGTGFSGPGMFVAVEEPAAAAGGRHKGVKKTASSTKKLFNKLKSHVQGKGEGGEVLGTVVPDSSRSSRTRSGAGVTTGVTTDQEQQQQEVVRPTGTTATTAGAAEVTEVEGGGIGVGPYRTYGQAGDTGPADLHPPPPSSAAAAAAVAAHPVLHASGNHNHGIARGTSSSIRRRHRAVQSEDFTAKTVLDGSCTHVVAADGGGMETGVLAAVAVGGGAGESRCIGEGAVAAEAAAAGPDLAMAAATVAAFNKAQPLGPNPWMALSSGSFKAGSFPQSLEAAAAASAAGNAHLADAAASRFNARLSASSTIPPLSPVASQHMSFPPPVAALSAGGLAAPSISGGGEALRTAAATTAAAAVPAPPATQPGWPLSGLPSDLTQNPKLAAAGHPSTTGPLAILHLTVHEIHLRELSSSVTNSSTSHLPGVTNVPPVTGVTLLLRVGPHWLQAQQELLPLRRAAAAAAGGGGMAGRLKRPSATASLQKLGENLRSDNSVTSMSSTPGGGGGRRAGGLRTSSGSGVGEASSSNNYASEGSIRSGVLGRVSLADGWGSIDISDDGEASDSTTATAAGKGRPSCAEQEEEEQQQQQPLQVVVPLYGNSTTINVVLHRKGNVLGRLVCRLQGVLPLLLRSHPVTLQMYR